MRYYKLVIPCLLGMLLLTACQVESKRNNPEENIVISQDTKVFESNKEIGGLYQSIYNKASDESNINNESNINSLDVIGKIVKCLGDAGYVAIDMNNYIDMVNPEQVERFCEQVEAKEKGDLTILMVMNNGGFIRYDFTTEEGSVDVVRSSLVWKEGDMESTYIERFQSLTWKYTENGYLFFEQYQPSGYDGASGNMAVRVKPLDEKCREYNMKYVLPIGYEINNLLITNWSEEDYGELNFYDLFDILYGVKYGKNVPYEGDNSGKEYVMPKNEFENVIKAYFKINSATLEEKTVYYAETKTYRYRPRRLYDCAYPLEPYPEVCAYEEQLDGTLKLIVNGIWVYENRDDAFSSELVVRPMEDGTFQYVSNRVIENNNRVEPIWYTNRLTDDEWERYYKNGGQ